jgi:hypothetical protein
MQRISLRADQPTTVCGSSGMLYQQFLCFNVLVTLVSLETECAGTG